VMALILGAAGVYEAGDLSTGSAYLYFTLVNNFASMWAIYCLVLFYFAVQKEIAPMNPVAKFLCIKAVVFFAWWQSVILVIVEALGGISKHQTWEPNDKGKIAADLQNLLICIEMLFVAGWHTWAFTYKEYRVTALDEDSSESVVNNLFSMFDFRDIGNDVLETTANPSLPGLKHPEMQGLIHRTPSKVDGEGEDNQIEEVSTGKLELPGKIASLPANNKDE